MKNQFLYEPPSEQNPKNKTKNIRKNKFLLGMINLAIIVPASCSSWGFPDPDGLSIPNWGKSTTAAPENSSFNATAMDADGNIVAVGSQLKGSLFNYGNNVTVTGGYAGRYNAVLVKYNALTGKTLWARSTVTAPNESDFRGVATDRYGNIYAVGTQQGSGIYNYGNSVSVSGGKSGANSNAVIIKYNSDGQALWARSTVTATDKSYFGGIAIDKQGYIYVVGSQGKGISDYGNGVQVEGAYATSSFTNNALIVKYNSDGQALWARSTVTATNESYFGGIAIDKQGYIYAVGRQSTSDVFDYGNSVTAKGANSSGSVLYNAVIVKYNSSGQALWAKSTVKAPGKSEFQGVAADHYGNVYAVGEQATGVFNYGDASADVKGGSTTTPSSNNSIVVKYSSDGITQWARSTVSGTDGNLFYAVATNFAGDVYAVGYQKPDDLYNYGDGVAITGDGGSTNAVLVKYNADGKAMWAKTTVKSGGDKSFFHGIVAGNHKLFVVGYQEGNNPYNYGNDAGDIKGAKASSLNVLVTTFGH